jgi:hypothetical protein
MTEQELEEFFQKVKGKEIRWTGWDEDEWFVPHTRDGRYIRGTCESGEPEVCCISNGFNECADGWCWEFVDEEGNYEIKSDILYGSGSKGKDGVINDQPKKKDDCTCTHNLFLYPCTCGYADTRKDEKENIIREVIK